MAISRKGNRIIKPTQDIFLFAWRKETNKCCVMKLFARFFNDTSYTHHKTIFNQCIIFSRQMFFQIVFHHFKGFYYRARVSYWQFNSFCYALSHIVSLLGNCHGIAGDTARWQTSRNGVWLDVKIMCKNAVFRARIYYLYNKNCWHCRFFLLYYISCRIERVQSALAPPR